MNLDTAIPEQQLEMEKDGSRENDQKLSSSPSTTKRTRTKQKTSDQWEKNMEELRAYKKKHGHVNVRQTSGRLGKWVNNVRTFYNNRKVKGENNSLTDDRVKDLDEVSSCTMQKFLFFAWAISSKCMRTLEIIQLGFVWKIKRNSTPKKKSKRAANSDTTPTKKPRTKACPSTISTKMLPDGTQVIESEEKLKHADGSTTESTTEEFINKRTIQLDTGARILETRTKIVMTKVERIVLPALLPETIDNTDNGEQKQSTEESDAKMPALQPANELMAVSVKDR
jgi:hypothetical protein